MPLPSNISYLGIAKETTKGTAVTPSAFIPVDPGTLKPADKIMYIEDKALRGAMVDVYDEIAGPTYSEFEFGGPAFPDTFPWMVAGLMGDVATTGASAPYTHTMGVKNTGDGQPKSYTLTDFYGYTGTHTRQFPGMQFSELGLKFNAEGILEYTTKAVGWKSALVAKPTQSFSAIPPIPSWSGTVTIGGAGATTLVDGSLTFKRATKPVFTVDNDQNPYAVWCGELMVDGQLTFIAEDDTELLRYLNNTKPTLVLDWSQGAGAALVEIKVTATKCAYVDATIDRGKEHVAVSCKVKPVANTTDVGATGGYGQAKWTLQNALASGTYV